LPESQRIGLSVKVQILLLGRLGTYCSIHCV
jgi:hypothetical protein